MLNGCTLNGHSLLISTDVSSLGTGKMSSTNELKLKYLFQETNK